MAEINAVVGCFDHCEPDSAGSDSGFGREGPLRMRLLLLPRFLSQSLSLEPERIAGGKLVSRRLPFARAGRETAVLTGTLRLTPSHNADTSPGSIVSSEISGSLPVLGEP